MNEVQNRKGTKGRNPRKKHPWDPDCSAIALLKERGNSSPVSPHGGSFPGKSGADTLEGLIFVLESSALVVLTLRSLVHLLFASGVYRRISGCWYHLHCNWFAWHLLLPQSGRGRTLIPARHIIVKDLSDQI